ncbi:MAG: NAD-dependent epimerase/dehydratase family protein [Pirellulaceae bacterium]|nr:NAD-dependent epimerase/dehydratase family protein [Pirellulaceae bacterium]
MQVLLTGATGFLGNNLLRLLLQKGHQVTALIRQDSRSPALADLDAELIQIALDSAVPLEKLDREFDCLIHCAAEIQIGRTKLESSRQANVVSTQALAQFCRTRNRRMVHVSTVDTLAYSPDGQPQNESNRLPAKPPATYVVTKSEAEQIFFAEVKAGLDGVVVHPGFMLGPFDWKPSSAEMMIAVAKIRPPFAPAGGASVADVRDVAAGIIAAVEKGRQGEQYILGGHNVSYLELWQAMARHAGVRPPRLKLPNWLARSAGVFGDIKTRLTGRETNVNSLATAMGQLRHYYSSDKAADELGYTFRPLDESIAACWEWIKSQGWNK